MSSSYRVVSVREVGIHRGSSCLDLQCVASFTVLHQKYSIVCKTDLRVSCNRHLLKASCDSDSVRAHRHISILIKTSVLEIWPLLHSLHPMNWKYTLGKYRQIVSLPVLAASQGTFADFKSRWTNLAWSTLATWEKANKPMHLPVTLP